ncbi:unnamed protein product [Caenorhabditis nigoni]
MRSWTEESMRSPSCNELPGQHGILLRRLLTSPLDEDHRDPHQMGIEDWMSDDGCCQLPRSFGCAAHCNFIFLKTDRRH